MEIVNNLLEKIAGFNGSKLYVGAATYKTSDSTLRPGISRIYIREDQVAMVTSMKVNDIAEGGNGTIVGKDLKAGDFYTFQGNISEIVISGGSFIGH